MALGTIIVLAEAACPSGPGGLARVAAKAKTKTA